MRLPRGGHIGYARPVMPGAPLRESIGRFGGSGWRRWHSSRLAIEAPQQSATNAARQRVTSRGSRKQHVENVVRRLAVSLLRANIRWRGSLRVASRTARLQYG